MEEVGRGERERKEENPQKKSRVKKKNCTTLVFIFYAFPEK